ncbi:MAG: agmatine deiminase family protein, partial [Methanobacteriota archaeon]
RGAAPSAPLGYVDWIFNAWGGKYKGHLADDDIPARLAHVLGMPYWEPGIVMEGGALDGNGQGTMLTTEQCLLNPNRNPALSRSEIEAALHDYLGARHVLWLGDGISGDDTDGHVDDIARFVGPSTVVACRAPRGDEDHEALEGNWKRLSEMRLEDGSSLRVVELPMPGRIEDDEGKPLPASYANFYIANGVVLLPVFGHENDARAARVLEACLPTRRIVPIRCEDMVHGLGTLHCASQQQPV